MPTISGPAKPGKQLSCSPGKWTGNLKFEYQRSRDGTLIPGATKSTYAMQASDEELTLTCSVTASNAGGTSEPVASKGVRVAVPKVRGCPAATGKLNGTMRQPAAPNGPSRTRAPSSTGRVSR